MAKEVANFKLVTEADQLKHLARMYSKAKAAGDTGIMQAAEASVRALALADAEALQARILATWAEESVAS